MAYHIDVTGTSGNITQIQYDRLKADADSYVILRTNDGVGRQLNFALERANVLLYSKVYGQNLMAVEVNPNLSYNFRTETIETTENKTQTITADSTTTEYPTAKTAFEYINSVVGISTYLLTVDASNINQNPSNPTKILSFGSVQLKFTAKQGYYLPDDVTVTNATRVWDELTGTLTISKPTGDVRITISGVAITYSISTSLTNVKADAGNATSIKTDETKVLKFKTEPGYSLPNTVKVQNATDIWDENSGSLVLTKPTGNVTITLVGKIIVYSIIVVANNIEQVPGNPTTITKGQTRVLRFSTVTGYNYPNSVTVTGAASNSWEKSTGTLTLVGGTGNISVNIAGSPQAYSITTNLPNVTANASNPKVIYRDSSVELKFTANDGYELPASIPTVTNVGSQSWNKTTGKLNLYNPTGNVTVTISGVLSQIVERYGLATALSQARSYLAATTVGNYALFGGGEDTHNKYSTVDTYDTNLTRTIPTELSKARRGLAATTVGNYALFGGGNIGGSIFTHVDAYDTSLTRTIPTELSKARRGLAATTVGNYALFGGGYSGNIGNTVDAYDTSLTRSIPTALSVARDNLAATNVGNYALFGGGDTNGTVDAYNASLTRTIPTELSKARRGLAATTVGSYALFGGGRNSFSDCLNAVDAYDTSLTRTIPTALSQARSSLAATTVDDCALFGGGYFSDYYSNVIDVYDTGLTRTIATELSKARSSLAATTVGDYALFGGGVTISSGGAFTQYNDVDAYTAFARSNFGNTDWATIAKAFKAGIANKMWNVGDTKTITSKSGKQYTIRIADMQSGRYAYTDGSRSSNGVLEFVELINLSGTKGFQMSTETSTNAGGFASSYMRNTTLLNILADLPDDMQAAMSEVNVLSGTGKGTTSGTSSSANKLFLPAEMEMFDAKHYSIGLEECPLGQFDYYKTHNTDADRIKRDIGSTSGNLYWLRSPSSDRRTNFCVVGRNGSYSDDYANYYLGVAPIFAI